MRELPETIFTIRVRKEEGGLTNSADVSKVRFRNSESDLQRRSRGGTGVEHSCDLDGASPRR